MFAKLSMLFVALAAASTVLASPWNQPPPPPAPTTTNNNCNVENQMCCNQTQDYDETTSSIIGLLGLNTQGANGQLGISCSPLFGTGGAPTCQANPVCCTGGNYNGVVAVGCSPFNAPLF